MLAVSETLGWNVSTILQSTADCEGPSASLKHAEDHIQLAIISIWWNFSMTTVIDVNPKRNEHFFPLRLPTHLSEYDGSTFVSSILVNLY